METILRGILSSDHPESLKNALLQKVISSMNHSEMENSDCVGLFKIYFEWILTSEKSELIRLGHEQLVKLAKAKSDVFRDFISPNQIIDLFSNSLNANKAEIATLIGEILDLLKLSSENENDALLRSITNIAKAHLVHFLRDHGIHLDVAASIGHLYSSQSSSILPAPTEWQKVTSLVVKLLAGYRCKDPHPVTGVVSTSFVEKADLVSEILCRIWGQSLEPARECIQESLRLFYVIISSSDSDSRPSCALMSFLDKVPSNMMEKAMESIISETSIQSEEGQTVVGLQTMVEWLTQRPGTLLAGWIRHMLIGLQKSQRFSVLIEITHGSLEKLLASLVIPELQDTVENLFFFLFMGFQHSETAFHRLVTNLPDVLSKLQNLPNFGAKNRSQIILERMVEATYFMLKMFPDFPDLYNPLVKKLEEFPFKPPSESRLEELSTLAWLQSSENLKETQSVETDGNSLPRPINSCQLNNTNNRSETGMVGLVNLGNTCYMNSVIQALYITKTFCDMVLSAPCGSHQPVLAKLQQTFAFLRHTLRAIYSPSDFLKSARPPWFESGRQQDCSEFLRYLLDTLQEQEKCGRTLTTYREHRVIEPPNKNGQDSQEAMEVKSSCSNTALDAISEVPEAERDVDMMSQEDEDFVYGSRNSLLNKDDDQVSEDEDISGSRNSLSGLKRWTTEENLSFQDHRGSRSELMETPLHDSHSNSTDSGIQSVGDSIRGSSDSMSNGNNGLLASASGNDEHKKASKSLKKTQSSFISLVHKVFGGKLQTSYQCSNCKSISLHKEAFTDLHLAVPTEKSAEILTMQKLVNNYLTPETLEDDNKYHCDICNGLQDAVKTMKILEGPEYLMTTLMRFHYDRTQNRKSKIFTDIDYELDLKLPISRLQPSEDTDEISSEEVYSLYAIVVHSGYSSDGGHYYTYARQPSQNSEENWYIFNDSKVSFSSFQSFKSVSKRFPRDTAYLLFYQKVAGGGKLQQDKINLRTDLKMSVENDNIKFMREKERINSLNKTKPHHDQDQNPGRGGSGGGGSCGGGGFNAPARFVC